LLAAASGMTPDPSSRPARRVTRGLARLIAWLALVALVAVTAACGSGNASGAGLRPEQSPKTALAPTPKTSAFVVQSEVPPYPTDSQTAAIQGPYTLRIPRIGVDARVVAIKSNEDRVLMPPRAPSLVGWWSDGAAPGEREGSAVLVGHTVRAGGGVFDDIDQLRSGDTIEVEGSDGMLTYRVQSHDVLSKGEFARNAEQIFTQAGPGRLVVITCDDWDGTAWRSNIVTVATPA
jgi:LPXTG-site transpeptidase (sortase) family protein